MKRKFSKFIAVVLVLVLCLVLICGCVPIQYNGEHLQDKITLKGRFEYGATKLFHPVRYAAEYATYTFDGTVDEQVQKQYVELSEKVLKYVSTYYEIPQPVVLYLGRDFEQSICENYSIGNIDDYKTEQQVQFILECILGSTANYGLVYGLSNYLARLFSCEQQEQQIKTKQLLDYLTSEDNVSLLDLTAPCFMNEYFLAEQIDYAEQFAIVFTKHLVKSEGIKKVFQLLSEYDSDVYSTLVKKYLSTQKLTVEYTAPSVQFGLTDDCYLHVITPHANWYILNEYDTSYDAPRFNLDIKTNYGHLRQCLLTLEAEMTKVDQTIKSSEYGRQPLEIIFYSLSHGYNYYNIEECAIYATTTASILHEYVHYLTVNIYIDAEANPIISEAAATYYGSFSSLYKKAYIYAWTKDASDFFSSGWFTAAQEHLGHNLDPANRQHYNILFDYYCYAKDAFTLNPSRSEVYIELQSFTNYIVEYYPTSPSFFLQYDEFCRVNDTNLEFLRQEWEAYITSEYSKYKESM